MPYILAIPTSYRRALGVAEGLGGIGLILLALTDILPWLTPLAAAGLMFVMAGAVGLHWSRRETPCVITTGILLVMVTLVAYMRWRVLPLGR